MFYIHVYTFVLHITLCINVQVPYSLCICSEPSGPPINLMLLASGPSTLLVSWSAPTTNSEVVLEYVIRCYPQNNVSDVRETTRIKTSFNAALTNLLPSTVYNCEVFTRSMFGESPLATASAMTPPRESKRSTVYMYTCTCVYT